VGDRKGNRVIIGKSGGVRHRSCGGKKNLGGEVERGIKRKSRKDRENRTAMDRGGEGG